MNVRPFSRLFFRGAASCLLLLSLTLTSSSQTTTIPQQLNAPLPKLADVLSGGYEVQTLDGKKTKLARLLGRNQPVLINFWATWCGPCRQEMPHLVALAEKYRSQGLIVVGLTIEDPKEDGDAVKAFTKKFGISYPTAFAPYELYQEFSGSARRAIPQTYVYASDGTPIKKIVGFNAQIIERLLTRAIEDALAHPGNGQKSGATR